MIETKTSTDLWVIGIGWTLVMLLLPSVLSYFSLIPLIAYGLLALSLGLIWGFGGILCFGQGAFFGLGAYVYAIAAINVGESTIPFALAIFIPAIIASLLGGMMFYGRLTDVYLAVVTLVFTLILYRFIGSTAGSEYVIGQARMGGFNGIPGFQTLNVPGDPKIYLSEEALYYISFFCLIITHLFCRWLLSTPFCRVCVGIRENERRCELLGYDSRLYKTALFSLGAAIAGLAGCLYANWAEIVTPQLFSLAQSAEAIIWVIVGGLGTLTGPIIGGFLLGLLKFFLGKQTLINNQIIMGLLLVFFVLLLPRGIMPILFSWWNKIPWSGMRRRRGKVDRLAVSDLRDE